MRGFGGGMMGGYGYGYGPGIGGGFGWMGIIGMAVNVLIWIGIIVLVVYLIRRLTGGQFHAHNVASAGNSSSSALNILNERFARGEITADEYKQMKQELLS